MIKIKSIEVGIIVHTELGDLHYTRSIGQPRVLDMDINEWFSEKIKSIKNIWDKDPDLKGIVVEK